MGLVGQQKTFQEASTYPHHPWTKKMHLEEAGSFQKMQTSSGKIQSPAHKHCWERSLRWRRSCGKVSDCEGFSQTSENWLSAGLLGYQKGVYDGSCRVGSEDHLLSTLL